MVDNDTGKSVLSTTDATPVVSSRSFSYANLEFDPGESPAGHVYLVLLDFIDNEGNPVRTQYEAEVTVPFVKEGDTMGYNCASFADGAGAISLVDVGDKGYWVSLMYAGDDVGSMASCNVIFEEPYEGPAPLETEVNTSLVVQWDRWIQKAAESVPDNYTLFTALVTPEGNVLQTSTTTGTGTGTVYKAEGGDGTIVAGTVYKAEGGDGTIGDKEVLLNIGF